MRLCDLSEGFSDIDLVRTRIRELKSARAVFDFHQMTVTLFFDMSDEDGVPMEGRATFRALPDGLTSAFNILRNKLSAAARSQQHGKPAFDVQAQIKACKEIGPNAIRILTNPASMELASLRWNGLKYA